MIGAIIGDIIGSTYEHSRIKRNDFELFPPGSTYTDDTILTVAVADCILHGKDYARTLKEYGRRYPSSYGSSFAAWLESPDLKPYGSLGNGSAMRVSPVGFAYDSLDKVLLEAKRSAEVTHNHLEGIKGAQATASAIFLARTGNGKAEIREYVADKFHYDLNRTIDDIRPVYRYSERCQETVPEAIIAFLDSSDYEDAVRKAISLGGDADTLACMAGGIAEAFYKEIPVDFIRLARKILDRDLLAVIDEFSARFR